MLRNTNLIQNQGFILEGKLDLQWIAHVHPTPQKTIIQIQKKYQVKT
jgi:hypothetical protein